MENSPKALTLENSISLRKLGTGALYFSLNTLVGFFVAVATAVGFAVALDFIQDGNFDETKDFFDLG